MLERMDDASAEIGFSQAQKRALLLAGHLIGSEPDTVLWFLEGWGIAVPENPSDKLLAGLLLQGLGTKRPEYGRQLAELLVWGWEEDAFLGGGGEVPELNLGADPVSAIAGAVGSIAELLGRKGKRKAAQEKARAETLGLILRQREARPPRAPYNRPEAEKGGPARIILLCGLVFGLCLGALFLFSRL